MKRRAVMILLAFLLCLTAVPTAAAESDVKLEAGKAAVGEIVYLPLSLETPQEANTLGIGLEFDNSALEFVAGLSSWSISGTIKSFDRQRQYALWAGSKTQNLSGELCRFAFRVKEGAKASQCSVTCNVILKIDSREVASYTAAGDIELLCRHDYGEWARLDDNAHSRTCQICGDVEYGAHKWDNGTVVLEPTLTQMGMSVRTCQFCDAKQEEAIPALEDMQGTGEQGSWPSQTQPSPQPVWPSATPQPAGSQAGQPAWSEESRPIQTQPPQSIQSDGQNSALGNEIPGPLPNQSGSSVGGSEENSTLVIPKEDVVVIKPDESEGTADVIQEVTSEEETAPEGNWLMWGCLTVAGCLLAGSGFWMLKKRKK